jgi:hypothetical protein
VDRQLAVAEAITLEPSRPGVSLVALITRLAGMSSTISEW